MSGCLSGMTGETITLENGMLNVPNNPTIHYIEGDGIGVDITPPMISVVDEIARSAASKSNSKFAEYIAVVLSFACSESMIRDER